MKMKNEIKEILRLACRLVCVIFLVISAHAGIQPFAWRCGRCLRGLIRRGLTRLGDFYFRVKQQTFNSGNPVAQL